MEERKSEMGNESGTWNQDDERGEENPRMAGRGLDALAMREVYEFSRTDGGLDGEILRKCRQNGYLPY